MPADTKPGARTPSDPDAHKGAVEVDGPVDPPAGNPLGPALDERGLPADCDAILEDAIGANVDETQG